MKPVNKVVSIVSGKRDYLAGIQNRILFTLLLIMAALLIPFRAAESASSFPDDKIIPLSEIRPGMKGIGLTVITGVSVESFDVEVLGVLKNSKLNESLVISGNSILVRVDGPVIQKAGGIAAGMSGSPIYIDGRLVGGLSSGWVMTDHTVGLVTPMEDMLQILHEGRLSYQGSVPDSSGESAPGSTSYTSGTVAPSRVTPKSSASPPSALPSSISPSSAVPSSDAPPVKPLPSNGPPVSKPEKKSAPPLGRYVPVQPIQWNDTFIREIIVSPQRGVTSFSTMASRGSDSDVSGQCGANISFPEIGEGVTLFFRSVASPVMMTGLTSRGISILNSNPALSAVAALPNVLPAAPSSHEKVELRPGSAVAVLLARGDINMTTLGTLTYIRNGDFIAFSHSFLKKGLVDFFFAPAHIYHCFSSVDMPFKVGAPLENVGAVTQDRDQCITGRLGQAPASIPLTMDIRDLDTGASRNFRVDIVRDQELLPTILMTVLVQASESVINRTGRGSAMIQFTVIGRTVNGTHKITRDEAIWSGDDVVGRGVEPLLKAVDSLLNNEFSLFVISEIVFSMKVTTDRLITSIRKVEAPAQDAVPGGELLVRIQVKPFRQNERILTKRIFIPSDFKAGEYTLVARAGVSSDSDAQDGRFQAGEDVEDFVGLMEQMTTSPSSSDVVLELLSPQDSEPSKSRKRWEKPWVGATLNMGRVVEGSRETSFQIREN
jgi:hypothetical protein